MVRPVRPDKYNALIVDANADSKGRLRQIIRISGRFDKVRQCSTLKEGLFQLEGEYEFDIIFVSKSLEKEGIPSFLKQAKETDVGRECAYILLERGGEHTSMDIATNMLQGIDGVLFEPFSTDGLMEVIEIANRVKWAQARKREQAAIKLVTGETISLIDRIAKRQIRGHNVDKLMARLEKATEKMKSMETISEDEYVEFIQKGFKDVTSSIARLTYKGASKRVKEKFGQGG